MSNDLFAFIRARLDREEAVARAATEGAWSADDETYAEAIQNEHGVVVVGGGRWNGEAPVFESTEDALHIAMHHPDRVLAEIDAKRRILTEHRPMMPRWCTTCDVPGDSRGREHGCTTVRLLGLPYADHPDYQREWRP
ncbi:DUF6221 family protein [Streptomyces sp. NPDC021012]|uniref:DUF6221 family protein n=1 Tax=Streptomyces sp. NPDC021012 TaxID=3365107 RepID=UPI0037B8F377